MAHGIPKEFWKNSHFENVRAGFLLRCQNSLWRFLDFMYWLLQSFKKRGKLLRQENAVTSTSKLILFYHCSVLKLKCGFQSLREHGTPLETHANIGAKFCLAINDLWHCAIHFVNWSLNLQDHIRIFQFALEECKVEPYFFIVNSK